MAFSFLEVYIDDLDPSRRLYYDGIFRGQTNASGEIIMTYDVGNETRTALVYKYLPDEEGFSHKYQIFYIDADNCVNSAHHGATYRYEVIMATDVFFSDLGDNNIELLEANLIEIPWEEDPGIVVYNFPEVLFATIYPAFESRLQGVKRNIVLCLEENQRNLIAYLSSFTAEIGGPLSWIHPAVYNSQLNVYGGPLPWIQPAVINSQLNVYGGPLPWIQPAVNNSLLNVYDDPRPGPSWMPDGAAYNGLSVSVMPKPEPSWNQFEYNAYGGELTASTPLREPNLATNEPSNLPLPPFWMLNRSQNINNGVNGTPFMSPVAVEVEPDIHEYEHLLNGPNTMRFDNVEPLSWPSWVQPPENNSQHNSYDDPRPGPSWMPDDVADNEQSVPGVNGTPFMPPVAVKVEPDLHESTPDTPRTENNITINEETKCPVPFWMRNVPVEDDNNVLSPETPVSPLTPFTPSAVSDEESEIYVDIMD